MKIGCCCGIDKINTLESIGITEIELSAGWISQLSEDDFLKIKNIIASSAVKASVCNCLMGGLSVSLYQDHQLFMTREYLNKLFYRLGEINIKYVVFGSGNYRKVPEGINKSDAQIALLEFLRLLTEIAANYSITVLIEPLNKSETNILLSTTEAMEYIQLAEINNLLLLVDLFHFDLENEEMLNIVKYKDHIKHVHIATPKIRCYPNEKDGYDYNAFFKSLKATHYDGIISVEAITNDFENDILKSKAFIESFIQT